VIVESTAQMAHALRLELVAEGVETEWDAQFLATTGYDYAQGYHFSRPLPADKCLAWIAEFNATAMLTLGDSNVTTALRSRAERVDEDFESRTA
jgi:sensor c-di-GMP phosphodiesterase-like protein